MTQSGLSEAVLRLLRDRLKSFEQLDVLLHLHRQPQAVVTIATVATEVHLSSELVAEALRGLQLADLVETDGIGYRYRPANDALVSAVDELVHALRERRAAVLSQMSANAIERIRSDTPKAFADSFVLGNKER